jgi:hypothetical protein
MNNKIRCWAGLWRCSIRLLAGVITTNWAAVDNVFIDAATLRARCDAGH